MKRKLFVYQGGDSVEKLWQKAKSEGYDGMEIQMHTVLVKTSENNYHAVFSTDVEDRHGEIVFQNWDLKHFKKNPVYLDSHNYESIDHIIGRITKIKSNDGVLEGDIEFAMMNPKGIRAQQMAEAGFLNTNSVGFIPTQFDEKGNILKAELLEVSAVAVPANPEALYGPKQYDNGDGIVREADENKGTDGTSSADDSDSGQSGGAEVPKDDAATPEVVPPVETPEEKAVKAVKELISVAEQSRAKRLLLLNSVSSVIRALGENSKVETPARDRATEKRLINDAIRKLFNQKR